MQALFVYEFHVVSYHVLQMEKYRYTTIQIGVSATFLNRHFLPNKLHCDHNHLAKTDIHFHTDPQRSAIYSTLIQSTRTHHADQPLTVRSNSPYNSISYFSYFHISISISYYFVYWLDRQSAIDRHHLSVKILPLGFVLVSG